MKEASVEAGELCSLVKLERFQNAVQASDTAIWRWEKDGLIRVIRIGRARYIHKDEIVRFEKRAMAGEFARDKKKSSSRKEAK